MPESILFKTCLGYTDSTSLSSNAADPKTGKTQLTGCENMTVTSDGCIQTAPDPVAFVTHTGTVTRLSAGSRMVFGDGIDMYEVDAIGTTAKRFPVCDGPIMHTPLDVRVSSGSKVYKSVNPTGAMTEAVVGTNPDPDTTIAYAKQPVFDGGFVYNGRAYCHKGKFLQYSKGYHYDLWDIGNGFIGHQFVCLQSGAVPGCIVVVHAEGLSVYVGGDPLSPDTVKRFCPLGCIDNTLFSGFISKAVGYGHIVMASDGVYMVAADGSLSRLTGDALDSAYALNNSYTAAVVAGGKYLAFGDQVAVEYDFQTKAIMLRSSGVACGCVFDDTPYIGIGSTVSTLPATVGSGACSFTTPYSNNGAEGRKSLEAMYLTGRFDGDLVITCIDQEQDEPIRWEHEVEALGACQNRRVKLPKRTVGSRLSFKIASSGAMRVEEIRLASSAGQRR